MGMTLTEKILRKHLVDGEYVKGEEIGIKIDQTLTQDATGTMAYLEFEAIGIPRVKTERSVAYIDHNTLQSGFENADDHRFIGSVAKKHGIYFSRPGNGICHQVHLERFGVPGKTLIGSDSHTPTGGGIGMIAIGAGGQDVAVAMGGGAYYITCPKVVKVNLTGKLSPWVSAKDVILQVLRVMSVKGGVGKVIEYCGEGVKTLSVPERATITNMGAELGATTSIFPSDEITLEFLKAQDRADVWVPLAADEDAEYDEQIDIDLSTLVPQAACPHSPDNVKTVEEIGKLKIDQVCIGSCTNSSFVDMMKVAYILKGKTVDPSVSLAIAPGSKQVLNMIAQNGALSDMTKPEIVLVTRSTAASACAVNSCSFTFLSARISRTLFFIHILQSVNAVNTDDCSRTRYGRKLTIPALVLDLLNQIWGEGCGNLTVCLSFCFCFNARYLSLRICINDLLLSVDFSNLTILFGLNLGSLSLDISQFKFLLRSDLLLNCGGGFIIYTDISEVYCVDNNAVLIELITQIGVQLSIDFSTLIAKDVSDGVICRNLLRPRNNLRLNKCILNLFSRLALESRKCFSNTLFVKSVRELKIYTNSLAIGRRNGKALIVRRVTLFLARSEERRVGKECRSRWSPYH